jgi:hypothetical protein
MERKMAKKVPEFLKQPWFYILCIELLIFFIFIPLSKKPGKLYYILPESWYDSWEAFAILDLAGLILLITLSLFLFSGSLAFGTLFNSKYKVIKKAGMVFFYAFLAFIALWLQTPLLGCAREKAKQICCRSNLKQIRLALMQYAGDNKSNLPPNLKTLSDTDYLTDECVYRCPSRLRPNTEFSDYLYYGAGRKIDEEPSFIMARDHDKNHLGKYKSILMSDGEIISSGK